MLFCNLFRSKRKASPTNFGKNFYICGGDTDGVILVTANSVL